MTADDIIPVCVVSDDEESVNDGSVHSSPTLPFDHSLSSSPSSIYLPLTASYQNKKSHLSSSPYSLDDFLQSSSPQLTSITALTIGGSGDDSFVADNKSSKIQDVKNGNSAKLTLIYQICKVISGVFGPFWIICAAVITGAIVATMYTSNTAITTVFSVLVFLAIPELFVFTIAFGSNFVNVIKNPEKSTSRILALFMLLLTTMIRCCFICFLFLAPAFGNKLTNKEANTITELQRTFMYVVSGWWVMTICIPPVMATFYSFKYGSGNRRLTTQHVSDSEDPMPLPKFILILPVYNEELELLVDGIKSILNSDYDSSKIILHIAFDSKEI
ncbi:hypothetical protein HK100_009806, partial [Physocladia obscura]